MQSATAIRQGPSTVDWYRPTAGWDYWKIVDFLGQGSRRAGPGIEREVQFRALHFGAVQGILMICTARSQKQSQNKVAGAQRPS